MDAQQTEHISHGQKEKLNHWHPRVEKQRMLSRGVNLRFSWIGPANSVVVYHSAIIYFYLGKQLLLGKVAVEMPSEIQQKLLP